MTGRNTLTIITIGLVPALILTMIFSIILLGQDNCIMPGAKQDSASVDPKSVPNKAIAGYGHKQLINAAYIIQAGAKLGLSLRDQTIGVMTAMGESSLNVIDYGDVAGPDSRGLFQQRNSWGSYKDRMDPFKSATLFFNALSALKNRDSLTPTIVAHKVQRNADPNHYTKYWKAAQEVVQGLSGVKATSSTANTGTSSTYNLGPVKPQTATVANTVGPMFGIKTIGGWRDPKGEKYDLEGHPGGKALDFMINDIPDGKAVGNRLAKYLQDNAKELGVKYIIWYQQIWTSDDKSKTWKPMADRGSITQNHKDHVHLSLTGQGKQNTLPFCTPQGKQNPNGLSAKGWTQPAKGPITSGYGGRRDPVNGVSGDFHQGIDFAGGGDGGSIWAAQSGTVSRNHPDGLGGETIMIDHGSGIKTMYKHMWKTSILVQVGDKVKAGQLIARVGSSGNSTGPHLHFEIHQNDKPIDPKHFLTQQGVNLK